MLTDLKVRQARARDADYKLGDGGGLNLLVTKAGSKSWRFKYRFADKEKRVTFGLYPEVALSEARDKRDEDRLVQVGAHPRPIRAPTRRHVRGPQVKSLQ